MAKDPSFLKQIQEIARPIWDAMLNEEKVTEEQIDMTFEDFCGEVRLELTMN